MYMIYKGEIMWYEIKIVTTSEAVEAVSYILDSVGAEGVWIEDPNDPVYSEGNEGDWDYMDIEKVKESLDFEGARVRCYVEKDEQKIDEFIADIRKKLESIKDSGLDVGSLELEYKVFENKDWNAEWKKHYTTFLVGEKIIVTPSWEEYDIMADEIVVRMDPGGAFGSGTHETTMLCMEVLESIVKKDMTVFDIGTGSGILGITASKLGAKSVIAVDVDKAAVETAKENVSTNEVSDVMEVFEGDLFEITSGQCDIMVANIIAGVIMLIAPYVKSYIKPGGYFVAGGILDDKVDEVAKVISKAGFNEVHIHSKGEWSVIVGR